METSTNIGTGGQGNKSKVFRKQYFLIEYEWVNNVHNSWVQIVWRGIWKNFVWVNVISVILVKGICLFLLVTAKSGLFYDRWALKKYHRVSGKHVHSQMGRFDSVEVVLAARRGEFRMNLFLLL